MVLVILIVARVVSCAKPTGPHRTSNHRNAQGSQGSRLGCKEAKEAGARSACSFWLSFKCNGYFGVPKPGRLECCQRCQPAHWHGTSAPRGGPASRGRFRIRARLSGLSVSLVRSQSVCGRAQTKIHTCVHARQRHLYYM